MTATARTVELRSIARAIADALPATVVEGVLTGSEILLRRHRSDELNSSTLVSVA